MAGLQSGEGRMMIDLVVCAQYINVTDIQTHRQPRRHSNSGPNALWYTITSHSFSNEPLINNLQRAAYAILGFSLITQTSTAKLMQIKIIQQHFQLKN